MFFLQFLDKLAPIVLMVVTDSPMERIKIDHPIPPPTFLPPSIQFVSNPFLDWDWDWELDDIHYLDFDLVKNVDWNYNLDFNRNCKSHVFVGPLVYGKGLGL